MKKDFYGTWLPDPHNTPEKQEYAAGIAPLPKDADTVCYKYVAVRPDGTLVSMWDNNTVYTLGKWMTRKLNLRTRYGAGWPEGGLYAFDDEEQARNFQERMNGDYFEAAHLPRQLIRCTARGHRHYAGTGKFACARLRPDAKIDAPIVP